MCAPLNLDACKHAHACSLCRATVPKWTIFTSVAGVKVCMRAKTLNPCAVAPSSLPCLLFPDADGLCRSLPTGWRAGELSDCTARGTMERL